MRLKVNVSCRVGKYLMPWPFREPPVDSKWHKGLGPALFLAASVHSPAGSSRSVLASRCEFSKHFPHPFRPHGLPSARAGQRVRLKGLWTHLAPSLHLGHRSRSKAGGGGAHRQASPRPGLGCSTGTLGALRLSLPHPEVAAGPAGVGSRERSPPGAPGRPGGAE